MYEIESPVGLMIHIPESEDENTLTFSSLQQAAAKDYYNENGYVVLRQAVDPGLCDLIREQFALTVKKYQGYIYRQTTANPEKNKINKHGFVMNPILNLQDLDSRKFGELRKLSLDAFTADKIKQFAKTVFSEDAKLVQSMYFEGNSETWPHQDTYYLDSEKIGTMIGAWFALEDIDAGAGRFFIVPGSHRIDIRKHGGDFDIAFNHARYKKLIRDLLLEKNLQIRAPLLRKGDVLFWNSRTIHGSLRTTRPIMSRSSLTAHLIPETHKFLQFQARNKPLKLKEFNGIQIHCPKDMDRISSKIVMKVETTFPRMFQTVKKVAIKLVVS